jgi:hypothetical protein
MNMLDHVQRAQKVGFTRAGRAAALVYAADRVRRAQHNGAASGSIQVMGVPDAKLFDGR